MDPKVTAQDEKPVKTGDPATPLISSYKQPTALNSETGISEELTKSLQIRQPNRTVVIEPIVGILAAVAVPLALALSLYVYREFEYRGALHYNISIANWSLYSTNQISCTGNVSAAIQKVTAYAQLHNSIFFIAAGLFTAVPCIVMVTFLGPYSDRAGRKYAIIIPMVATLFSTAYILVIVSLKLNIWLLLIGFFIEGLGGGINVLLLGCFAYIVDTTKPQNLQFRLTVIELIMIIPASVTPMGIGYWIQNVGYSSAVLAALIGTLLTLIYTIFFVPETVIKDPEAKLWSTSHIKEIISLFTVDNETKRMVKLRWLYLAFVPVLLVTTGNNLTILFLKNIPFCWNSVRVGVYLTVYIAFTGLGGVISAKLLKYCVTEHGIALVSGISSVVKMTYHSLVWNTISVYFIPPLSIFSMLFNPTLRTLMSHLVGPREQGAVFGAVAITQVVMGFIGNIIFTSIYASTSTMMSGFVYLVMAVFYLAGTLVFVGYLVQLKRTEMQGSYVKIE